MRVKAVLEVPSDEVVMSSTCVVSQFMVDPPSASIAVYGIGAPEELVLMLNVRRYNVYPFGRVGVNDVDANEGFVSGLPPPAGAITKKCIVLLLGKVVPPWYPFIALPLLTAQSVIGEPRT